MTTVLVLCGFLIDHDQVDGRMLEYSVDGRRTGQQ